MPKYQLTGDQKRRLCSIVEGLKEGYIKTQWTVLYGGDRVGPIAGLQDKENTDKLWQEVWDGVTFADFADFVDCGFFRNAGYDRYGQPTNYTLNKQRIIDACENDFEMPTITPPVAQTIYNIDNTGIVNIETTLHRASQTINNAPALNSSLKHELSTLLDQLNQQLVQSAENYPEEAEAITTQAVLLAQEVSREKPNKLTIRTIINSLQAMAERLPAVAKVLEAISKIAEMIN